MSKAFARSKCEYSISRKIKIDVPRCLAVPLRECKCPSCLDVYVCNTRTIHVKSFKKKNYIF